MTAVESRLRSWLRDRLGARRLFSVLLAGTLCLSFASLLMLAVGGSELQAHHLDGIFPAGLAILFSVTAVLLGCCASSEFTRESLLLATLEETPDLIAINDSSGKTIYRNAAFHRFLNPNGDSLITHPMAADPAHEWSRAEVEDDALPRAGRGEVWRGESAFTRFDGKAVPMSHIMVGHLDSAGVTLGTISIARDSTEQKMIEGALRDTQNSIQKILDASPALVYIYDIATRRVQYCNVKTVDLLGYTQDEVNQNTALNENHVHPADMPLLIDALERVVAAKDHEVVSCEYRSLHKSGTWLWLTAHATPYKRDENGTVVQVIASAMDITGLKTTQEDLKRERERFKDIVDVQRAIMEVELDWSRLVSVVVEGALAISKVDAACVVLSAQYGYETKYAVSGECLQTIFDSVEIKESVAECFRTSQCQSAPDISVDNGQNSTVATTYTLPIFRDDIVVAVIQLISVSSANFDSIELEALRHYAGIVSDAFNRSWSNQHRRDLMAERVATLNQLEESEEQFRAAIDAVHEALILRDSTGAIRVSNKSAERILGFPAELLFQPSCDHEEWIVLKEDRTEFPVEWMPDRVAIQSGLPQPPVVLGIERMDGNVSWLSVSAAPLFRQNEETPYAAVTTFSDISERKAAFEANARLAAIVDSSQDGIIGATLDGIIVNWNPGAERLFGFTEQEIVGNNSAVFFTPNDKSLLRCIIKSLINGDEIDSPEGVRLRKDGSKVDVSITYSLVRNANLDPIGFAAIVRDITERKRYEHQIAQQMEQIKEINAALEHQKTALQEANVQLEALAMLDGLTGLKNHRVFQERLQQEFKRARRYHTPLSMVILDVDHFKGYNDQFGHPAGDMVLKTIAHILVDTCRASDIVARYGGEEFVVILPQTESDGAAIIAERCRVQIEKHEWPHRAVTASFGINTVGIGTITAASFISGADQAMYQSKKTGKNRVTQASEVDLAETLLVAAKS